MAKLPSHSKHAPAVRSPQPAATKQYGSVHTSQPVAVVVHPSGAPNGNSTSINSPANAPQATAGAKSRLKKEVYFYLFVVVLPVGLLALGLYMVITGALGSTDDWGCTILIVIGSGWLALVLITVMNAVLPQKNDEGQKLIGLAFLLTIVASVGGSIYSWTHDSTGPPFCVYQAVYAVYTSLILSLACVMLVCFGWFMACFECIKKLRGEFGLK